MVSCNCQKPVEKEKDNITSNKIKAFLLPKDFKVLQTTELIVLFDIQKKLIEGTNEYSNKLVIRDTLNESQAVKLLSQLQNDELYNWESKSENLAFDPTKQLLLKSENGRLSITIDEQSKTIGFTSLEGQRLLPITHDIVDSIKN
jgi:hypothetical protein